MGPLKPHYVKAEVHVQHYPDATLALFHGLRYLARYLADGNPAFGLVLHDPVNLIGSLQRPQARTIS